MSTAATTTFDDAVALIGETASRDVPLAPYTTYRVGGRAAVLARPRHIDQFDAVAAARRATGLPLVVVGKGSNMLVADDGFNGIAVSLADLDVDGIPADQGYAVVDEADGEVIVEATGAASLPALARRLAAAGMVGFEWAVGIPGSLGGAVKMNAGGHGSDVAAVIVDASVASLDGSGGRRAADRIGADALGLRFRGSDVGDDDVVVSARLRLSRGDSEAAMARIAEIVRWRREHQPGGQNCGSVFVNPVPGEVSAGLLVDGLGLRGLRIGGAWVSDKHANFIQASPGGRAADVLAVIEAVRSQVAAGTGYVLRSEVRLVGFDPNGQS